MATTNINPFDFSIAPSMVSAPDTPQYRAEGLRALGAKYQSKFTQYEQDRRLAELKWARNARQYLGVYDPEVERDMDKNRARAYPKLTRVKCVSMLSRLMNLLFQAGDKNWSVIPSPVPDITEEDLQGVLNALQPPLPPSDAMGMPSAPAPELSSDQIEQAIREFAKKRAERLELEIEDQLTDIGGSRQVGYVALARKVLMSGIQYGAGVLKGPFLEEQPQRYWERDAAGKYIAKTRTVNRPRYEFVPLWDYYPDMSAKGLHQMEGQFQRVVMSRHQVLELKTRPDFIVERVDEALRMYPQGNYMRRAHETELRAAGVQINVNDAQRNKYEAVVWHGHVSGKELAECGLDVPEDQTEADMLADVWVIGSVVIKVQLDPWLQLVTNGEMRQYHHFIFEEDETFLLGNGLPNVMRDSQMGLCAAVRMALDNGGVQRVFEVKTQLLSPNQDLSAVTPDKMFFRDDDSPATLQYPAIVPIELPMALPEYQGLARMFQEFADQETFVSAATGGDMQRGPSEPFRTAAGASMLRGDAALPFKDVVRNFDAFTESVMGSLINFNRNFNLNPELRGDFQPVARGATSLIAKEVLGMQLDNLAQTLTAEEKQYINMRKLARERIKVRDLNHADIVFDDAKCDQIDQQRQQQIEQQTQQQAETMRAQVREILSQTMKNLAQAQKNTANAEAVTANAVMKTLEAGLMTPLQAEQAALENQQNAQAAMQSSEMPPEATAMPAQ